MSIDLLSRNAVPTKTTPLVYCTYQCGYHSETPSLAADHEANDCILRPYKCQYCQYSNSYQDVTEIHQRTCLKYPVNCPYECGSVMTRYKLMSHIESDCTLVPVQCPFSWAGCSTPVTRGTLPSHVKSNTELHLSLLTNACCTLHKDNQVLKESNETLKKSNNELSLMCNQLYSVVTGNLPSLPVKLSFDESMNEEDELSQMVFFYSSKYGYKMSLTYTRSPLVPIDDNDCLSNEKERDVMFDKLELTVHSGVFDNQLQWPFVQNVTIKCVIEYKGKNQTLNLKLTHEDSNDDRTLFLSPLPPLDEEEDRERFLVHVVYSGDRRPWTCKSIEIVSIE